MGFCFAFLATIAVPLLPSSMSTASLCFIVKYATFCFSSFSFARVVCLFRSGGYDRVVWRSASSIDCDDLCVFTGTNNHMGISFFAFPGL